MLIKPKTMAPRLLPLLVVVLLAATDGVAAEPAGKASRAWLRRGVRVLDASSLAGLAETAPGLLQLDQATPALRGVRRGDVLVAGADARTPAGLLRRVTAVERRGGHLIVATTEASLEDVFWFGRGAARIALAPDPARVVVQTEGVRVADTATAAGAASAWSPGRLELELVDVVVYDLDGDPATIGDQVRARGSIGLEPSFDLELDVAWGRLRRLAFTNTTRLEATLELDARARVELVDRELRVAVLELPPATLMLGPIPVVLVPVLELKLAVSGGVSAGLRTSVSVAATAAAGAGFEHGAWSGWSRLPDGPEDLELSWQAPELRAAAQAEARVGPRLTVLLYGVAGPYASVFGYSAVAAALPSSAWTLDVGLRGEVGVAVGGPAGSSHPVASFDRRWPIAAGVFGAETAEPSP
jgi:hypothetical protein